MSPTTEQPNFDPDYRRYNTSFTYLIISLVLFVICAAATYSKMSNLVAANIADFLIVVSFVFIFGFSLAGFILGVRSFIKKEDNHYKKWVGFLGNLVFVLLFLFGLILNFFTFFDFMNS